MKLIGAWWRKLGWLARTGVIALALLVVTLIVGVMGRWLLTPAADVTAYSEYFVNDPVPLTPGKVSVTFFGVSTLLLDDGQTQLLIDAFFTRPTAMQYLFGGIKSDRELVEQLIADYDIDRLEAVFVSHTHVDHALDVGLIGELTGATIAGTESTLNIARGANLPESQLLLIEPGDTVERGDFTVQVVESAHSVSPVVGFVRSALPGDRATNKPKQIKTPLPQPATILEFAEGGTRDFVITHSNITLVIKGSANYVDGALDGIDADVLFVGVTLLGRQNQAFQTAFLNETIDATTPKIVVPLHWDDFLKSWELGQARFNPRVIDLNSSDGIDLVLEHIQAKGIDFALLQAGRRMVIAR